MIFEERTTCRLCQASVFDTVLDLGMMKVNAFPLPTDPEPESAPLELVICPECKLVQLKHSVEADRLYRIFHYRSGITQTMRDALKDVVDSVGNVKRLQAGDVVVDIGANDGSLLRCYPRELVRVGFEPAVNLVNECSADGVHVVADYFSQSNYEAAGFPKAAVVTAIAMFYDLDNPVQFLREVRGCMRDDGILVLQLAYLGTMLSTNDFANICHEHVSYYSLTTLCRALKMADMAVFGVEFNQINGGSIRLYIAKAFTRKWVSDADLQQLLDFEQQHEKFGEIETYHAFAKRIADAKRNLLELLGEFANPYVYGASTKGNTMLQYWGIDSHMVRGAADRDPRKFGRQTVNRIPIVSEQEARQQADAFLVNIWHFRPEIMDRENEWLNAGGTMIFPMPLVETYKKKTVRVDQAHQ